MCYICDVSDGTKRKLQMSRTVTAELTRRANMNAVRLVLVCIRIARVTSGRTDCIVLRSPKVHIYGVE